MPSDTITPLQVLTAQDRCDRCGAQAYVRARFAGQLFVFLCAHHGRQHMGKLIETAEDILDESDRLYAESQLMKQATTEV